MKTFARCRQFAIVLCLSLIALGRSTAAEAASVTYTDKASFLSEIVASTVAEGDFNDLTVGNTYTNAQMQNRTVGPYSYDVSVATGGFFTEGTETPLDVFLTTSNQNTVMTFASLSNGLDPVEAFGGQFFALDSSGNFSPQQVTASINGGAFEITKTPSSVADSFFGWVVGPSGISSVEISIGAALNTTVATNSVTFAVPEPSTYALVAMAATTGGICQLRRRRNSKKAQG